MYCTLSTFTRGRDSSVGIATRYGLDGLRIESRWGARFSAPVQTGPGAYPASCTMGTESFPGVKRPGRGADHPPPSNCRGHERVGLYLYSTFGPSWPVMGKTFTFTFTYLHPHIASRLEGPGNASLDVKRPGLEAYHSPPSQLPAYAIKLSTWTTYLVNV